jgi:hypothetical protein
MLGKFFRRSVSEPAKSIYSLSSPTLSQLVWDTTKTLPIPAWESNQRAIEDDKKAELHLYWSQAASTWLERLSKAFDAPLQIYESEDFFLLSALPQRPSEVLLEYAQKAKKRNLATLDGIASDEGYGKHIICVLHDEDDYYRYVSEYYPQDGEFAFSGGMFIQDGYGHFVFRQGEMDSMEPTLVHELAHALLSHLPIPAWVNEGLAVNTERRWAPRPPQYKPHEMAYMHAKFWNPETMQEFWSGKSYLRPDEGSALSYDLAQRMIAHIGKDHAALVRFVSAATGEDGGHRAAVNHLGVELSKIVLEVIGANFASPEPESWSTGKEKGWF